MFQCGEYLKSWSEKSQIPCWYAKSTTSTNEIARENVFSPEPITIYTTEHQTAGKGRNTNIWNDNGNGQQMLSSWVFLMSRAPQPVLAPAIGAAVYSALATSFPWLNFSLKAPNDIYLDGKKLAGILIENIQQGDHHRLIVGLGMNVWKSPNEISNSISLNDRAELSDMLYFNILDRLLLEMSLAISQTRTELSPNQREVLKHALQGKYDKVDADGSLWQGSQKIHWSDL